VNLPVEASATLTIENIAPTAKLIAPETGVEGLLVVDRVRQADDIGRSPTRVEGHRAEGVAEDVAEKFRLHGLFGISGFQRV
jgi:hypothetical protein